MSLGMSNVAMGVFFATCPARPTSAFGCPHGACSMFGSSVPRLLSGIPLHSDDDWTVALGPVIGMPMAWKMGVEACTTPSGPLVMAYMLIVWHGFHLIR